MPNSKDGTKQKFQKKAISSRQNDYLFCHYTTIFLHKRPNSKTYNTIQSYKLKDYTCRNTKIEKERSHRVNSVDLLHD